MPIDKLFAIMKKIYKNFFDNYVCTIVENIIGAPNM